MRVRIIARDRSLPEQFFNQWSFQHHPFGSHTNTDSDTERNTNGNTYCHSNWDSNSNADTECYTDSDGYTDDYAKAHARRQGTHRRQGLVRHRRTYESSVSLHAGLGTLHWGRTLLVRCQRVLSQQGRALTICAVQFSGSGRCLIAVA